MTRAKKNPPGAKGKRRPLEDFTEVARKNEADESGKSFERIFGKIVPPKKPKTKSETEKTRKPGN